MGSVWEGVHATLGNRVACKFIEPEYVDSSDAIERFENEARAAASLKSKHVVDVYDHGVLDDGRPYIVMEFLEGEALDARISKRGALPLQEVAKIVRQVSLALTKAHEKGIVHRDLKPENVFLVWDAEDQADLVKVVDFGIAKFTDAEAAGISSVTKTGSILGTPYYMSPEQARGLKNLDARSDNWSLGVIAYQALTGHIPFDGEAVGDLLVKICTVDPIPPSQWSPTLFPAVDEWMKKALNREPGLRFQDARAMAEALLNLAELPQGGTLGSAIRNLEATALASPGTPRTQNQGSPKATSGALTHANVTSPVEAPIALRKTSPLIWVGVGLAITVAAGGLILRPDKTESDLPSVDDSEARLAPDSAAATPSPVEITTSEKADVMHPQVEKEVVSPPEDSEEVKPEAEPSSPPTPPSRGAPLPRPRPSRPSASPSPRPRPRPAAAAPQVAPTPAPQPAPAPAPTPRPPPKPAGVDLGY